MSVMFSLLVSQAEYCSCIQQLITKELKLEYNIHY